MHYVIIGASAAGLTAAKTIRQRDSEGTITVVSIDAQVYSRVMLHQVLSGAKSAQGLSFVPADFFEANRIQWLAGERVSAVSTKQKSLSLESGTVLSYDKLLLAAGAQYVVPPLPHFREANNVFGLRNLSDAEKMIKAVEAGAKQCVIVGSGLVGLDAASALCERGVRCAIVEMADRLSPLQLDAAASKPYQEKFEAHGCSFYLAEKASDAAIDGDGNLTSVSLASGVTLPCDFVVVAAGVRPNIGFLEDSGIALDRAVVVDRFMRTNLDTVWAAGDVAGITGIWPNVMQQGEIAGKNMCAPFGDETPYKDQNGTQNRMNYYGLSTVSIGAKDGGPDCRTVVRQGDGFYWKAILQEERVLGVLLQGNVAKAGFFQKLVNEKTPVEHLGKELFDLTPADFS